MRGIKEYNNVLLTENAIPTYDSETFYQFDKKYSSSLTITTMKDGRFFFFIEFSLPCHAFQTRHICFSMHNSLNIVSIICNFSTMLALQR